MYVCVCICVYVCGYLCVCVCFLTGSGSGVGSGSGIGSETLRKVGSGSEKNHSGSTTLVTSVQKRYRFDLSDLQNKYLFISLPSHLNQSQSCFSRVKQIHKFVYSAFEQIQYVTVYSFRKTVRPIRYLILNVLNVTSTYWFLFPFFNIEPLLNFCSWPWSTCRSRASPTPSLFGRNPAFTWPCQTAPSLSATWVSSSFLHSQE